MVVFFVRTSFIAMFMRLLKEQDLIGILNPLAGHNRDFPDNISRQFFKYLGHF